MGENKWKTSFSLVSRWPYGVKSSLTWEINSSLYKGLLRKDKLMMWCQVVNKLKW